MKEPYSRYLTKSTNQLFVSVPSDPVCYKMTTPFFPFVSQSDKLSYLATSTAKITGFQTETFFQTL